MLKKLIAAAAFAASLGVAPALADYTFFDASKVVKTVKSFGSGNTVIQGYAPMDSTGAAFGTPGNPISINCITGCSGGGGGGGAVFGPTAVGAPAANPPILIGGTVDGTATGAISAWKVLAGIGFINCANCSGSGISVGFGGAIGGVGTPGGFKDGSGNFQPLLGDVTNGQWVNIKASATIPVSLTSTTITGSVAVTGTFWQATQPVSIAGSVAVTGPLTDTQLRATAVPVSGTFFQATQPVSIAATVAVSGPLTDTQLRASAVPVSLTSTTITGSVTVAQASAASLNATVVGTGTFAVQASIASASAWGINTLGSTTSGQSGQLALGAVTTAAPTYTTAQSNALSLTTGGLLRVDGSGVTQPVSGTVAFSNSTIAVTNAGTFAVQLTGATNNINNISGTISLPSGASTGVAQGSTTSGQVGTLMQGAVTTANPTYTNAQTSPLSVDTSGGLRVSIIAGGGSGGTASSFAAAFPATGTAVGMSQGGNMVAFTGTSGNLNVQCANCSGSGASATDTTTFTAGASVFAPGGGFFQTTATNNALTNGQQGAWQMTANRAGFVNLRDTSGTAIGTSAAELFIGGRGTAGSAAGGVLSVQGVASMTPILTNPGTAANWGINTLGSTTSGQSGTLGLGAVTTAAPTYTTAQSNALSLTTAGALRVDGSGVTQPVSLTSTTITGTVAVTQSGSWSLAANQSVNVSQINGITPLMGNGVTGTGSQRVTIASDNTAFTVNAAQSGTWNITNISGTVSLPTGAATAAKQPALGTAGSASTDVITVQGIASMTPLLANPGTAANWGINTLGSTTSGQSGQLALGAVTTAAPTYTTAQSNALSLTTAGDLRTVFSNTTIAVTQGTASNLNATVVGTGTFAVQAAQSGNWPVRLQDGAGTALTSATRGAQQALSIQVVDASGNQVTSFGGANASVSTTASAVPASATYIGMAQGGNLTGLTGTSGNLNVQCANCSGSGVSTADAATFTAGASLFAGGGGFFQTTATSNPLTNGQQGMFQVTANRALFTNLRDSSGTEVGVSGAELFVGGRGTAGSAAGGVLSIQGVASMTPVITNPASATAPVSTMNSSSANAGLNAANAAVFDDVTPTSITEDNFGFLRMSANRNLYGTLRDAAGNERGANVDASNRLTTAPTLVSGSVASGAFASGSVASGAFASGSIASGALASGSIAAGAMVDLLTMRQTVAAGTVASNSLLTGGIYNSSPITLTNGQGAALQLDASGYLSVNVKTATGLAQGSTTSGQSGSLVMGAVTTSAPTYTTAQTSPLSLDTGGSLRVVCTSGCGGSGGTSSNFGSAFPTAGTAIGLTNGTNMVAWSASSNYGTGPGAIAVPAVNAAVTNTVDTNVSQINGVTPLMGNGATGTGSQRVTIANDSSAIGGKGEGATGATVPTGAVLAGAQSGANMVALIQASASAAINVSTATTTQLVALSGSTKIYVTSYDVIAGGTGNITFVYGTGSNCGTGTTSLTGAYNLTAQAGIAKGGGLGPVLVVPAGNALCVTTSAAVQMSGSIAYTQF